MAAAALTQPGAVCDTPRCGRLAAARSSLCCAHCPHAHTRTCNGRERERQVGLRGAAAEAAHGERGSCQLLATRIAELEDLVAQYGARKGCRMLATRVAELEDEVAQLQLELAARDEVPGAAPDG